MLASQVDENFQISDHETIKIKLSVNNPKSRSLINEKVYSFQYNKENFKKNLYKKTYGNEKGRSIQYNVKKMQTSLKEVLTSHTRYRIGRYGNTNRWFNKSLKI